MYINININVGAIANVKHNHCKAIKVIVTSPSMLKSE